MRLQLRPPGVDRGRYEFDGSEIMDKQIGKLETEIERCARDFTYRGDSVDIEAWLERLHLEMTKFSIMQRMFVQMKKRMDALRLKSVLDLVKHCLKDKFSSDPTLLDELTRGRVRGTAFLAILGGLRVLRPHVADDVQYVLDEYQYINREQYEARLKKYKEEQGDDLMPDEQNKNNASANKDSGNQDKEKGDEDRKEENAKKDFAEQQSKEIKLKLERECTYFEIAEIEADYDDFVQRLLPETIRGVLFLLAFLRERDKWSMVELLFFTSTISKNYDDLFPAGERESMEENPGGPGDRPSLGQRTRSKYDVERLPLYIDPWHFQLLEAIVTVIFKDEQADRDFKSLFSIFLLQASGGRPLRGAEDKRIPFTFLQQQISIVHHSTRDDRGLKDARRQRKVEEQVQDYAGWRLFDHELEQKMVEDARKMLIRSVAYLAHVAQQRDALGDMLGPRSATTNRDCYQLLRDKFGIDRLQIAGEEVIYLVLYELFSQDRERHKPGRILLECPDFAVDVRALNEDFEKQIKILMQRDEVLQELATAILEKGYTFALLFESILGTKTIPSATIDEE